jgi:hypothetical protein
VLVQRSLPDIVNGRSRQNPMILLKKKILTNNFVHIREKKAREYTCGLTDPSHAIGLALMDSRPAPMPK